MDRAQNTSNSVIRHSQNPFDSTLQYSLLGKSIVYGYLESIEGFLLINRLKIQGQGVRQAR
jgi:hypothetical protein